MNQKKIRNKIYYIFIFFFVVLWQATNCWSWERVLFVPPRVIIEPLGELFPDNIARYTNPDLFSIAVSRFEKELRDMTGLNSSLEIVNPEDFYKKWEESEKVYLRRFLEQQQGDFIVYGEIYVDIYLKVFDITFFGYDPRPSVNVAFPITFPLISSKDISYLEELYVQAFFDVFNEDEPF